MLHVQEILTEKRFVTFRRIPISNPLMFVTDRAIRGSLKLPFDGLLESLFPLRAEEVDLCDVDVGPGGREDGLVGGDVLADQGKDVAAVNV